MSPPMTAAIPAFALGLLLLVGLVGRYRTLARLRRQVEDRWEATAALLDRRREHAAALPVRAREAPELAPFTAVVQRAHDRAAAVTDRADRVAAEQELSRRLNTIIQMAEAAGIGEGSEAYPELADLFLEMQVREQQIAEARERYNEVAAAWNTHRAAFPTGLLARALSPEPSPLFRAVE